MKARIDVSGSAGRHHGRRRGAIGLVLCVAVALVAGGCSIVKDEVAGAKSLMGTVTGSSSGSSGVGDVGVIGSIIMREADRYVGIVAQAADDFQGRVETTEARSMALAWKLEQGTAAYVNATGENPRVNALDMVILAAVSRMVMEDYWVGEKFGAPARPLLEAHRVLESNAWTVAHSTLGADDCAVLARAIEEWRSQNPRQRQIAAARMTDFVRLFKPADGSQADHGIARLFSLAMVNPLAGLDPAVRAVEESRQLAARAMYYVERAPRLWSWQVELLTLQLADQPESRRVLGDVGRLTGSAEAFARTAEALPRLITSEREAAIRQLFAGVAAERSNIVAGLMTQEARLRELLPQIRQTLSAGAAMGGSVDGAIKSLDLFVRLVSPPATNAAVVADTNSRPFNILDYATTAARVEAMAREVNTLLATVNQGAPAMAKLGRDSAVEFRAVVNHAFRLGLVLVAVAGLVAVGVVWTCRRIKR